MEFVRQARPFAERARSGIDDDVCIAGFGPLDPSRVPWLLLGHQGDQLDLTAYRLDELP